jgi:hypothetical protein
MAYMRFIYVDESHDDQLYVLSAMALPADSWSQALDQVVQYRRDLKRTDGIYVSTEFHAWKFVSGRGNIADRIVTKARRCEIFVETLKFMTTLPGIKLFNAALTLKQADWAFERLINRINRALQDWQTYGILICDEGNEATFTRLLRKLRRFNPIPSRRGVWRETGKPIKNIPIDRILEDPFFKRSYQSYFLQLVDFAAYALLRRERPLASKSKYGLDKAFANLKPILVLDANPKDPDGIIR